ncbi:hypothetical protein [Streptomyces sp. NBC_00212]|uniref:hypothetical protein n=1 Tax=Streptomyces sp. NBC_00212 TaxID=2975684 RepID=UPI00324ED61D
MRIKKRLCVLLASTALLGGLGLGATSTPASAASACSGPKAHNNSDGLVFFKGSYNLKNGPASECGSIVEVSANTRFYVWCGYYNAYGNLWLYGRISGSETTGWESFDNFTWITGGWNLC